MDGKQYSKGDIVQVTSVDMYGFCGRDYHPRPKDVGVTAEVVKAETYVEPSEDGPYVITILKCLTFEKEPRFLELVDFEVDLIGSIHVHSKSAILAQLAYDEGWHVDVIVCDKLPSGVFPMSFPG